MVRPLVAVHQDVAVAIIEGLDRGEEEGGGCLAFLKVHPQGRPVHGVIGLSEVHEGGVELGRGDLPPMVAEADEVGEVAGDEDGNRTSGRTPPSPPRPPCT